MVQFNLPRNSRIGEGRRIDAAQGARTARSFRIYRWNPEDGQNPRKDTFILDTGKFGPMILDALIHIKNTVRQHIDLPPVLP